MRLSAKCTGIGLSLALFLASCGGGSGGTSTSTVQGSKLFIVDSGNHAIISLIDPVPSTPGAFSTARVLSGPSTGLGGPGIPSVFGIPSIALDAANDRLFVAIQGGPVVVFDNISMADGDVPYSRSISADLIVGGGLRFVDFVDLSLDVTRDVLYTLASGGEVHIFNNASARNGLTFPNRTITADLGTSTVATEYGIAIDTARDMLYVGLALNSGTSIVVFNNAHAADTANASPLAPDRVLSFPKPLGSFYLDIANDRLYASEFDGAILIFDNASTLATGAPTPDRTITLGATQNFIFVDAAHDRLYAVGNDTAANAGIGYTINQASIRSGSWPTDGSPPTINPFSPGDTAFSIFNPNLRLSAVAVKP